jgi:thiosulfate/3-mercaptopyruvate sulfurtransferase
MYSTLIRPSELAPCLADPEWAVIDCRFDLQAPDKGEYEYLESHVPGAIYAHLDRDLSGARTGTNGRHPLPSVREMEVRFSSMGIDERVQVVVYDASTGVMAARLWWMLRYVGHDAVSVLDGGLAAWNAEGRYLASGRETRHPRVFTAHVRDFMRIDVDGLETSLASHLLIDARAPERFRGEVEPYDPVKGHIPGAANHPTSESLSKEGRFLDAGVLRERFVALIGTTPIANVVSYCGSGVTACHNLLAMEIAGLEGARLYPGSWSEWCADARRPIEPGP